MDVAVGAVGREVGRGSSTLSTDHDDEWPVQDRSACEPIALLRQGRAIPLRTAAGAGRQEWTEHRQMRKTAISMGTPTDAMAETVARPASLGMYDFSWLRRANDTFWAAVARELRSRGVQAVPQHLDSARPLDAIWRNSNLLLAQTCGYPLITSLSGRVSLVATPVYDLPGCFGATHRSLVVVRAGAAFGDVGALRGTRAATMAGTATAE